MKKNQKLTALISALNLNEISSEKPGEEWFTAWGLSEASNRSLSHTSKRIRDGIRLGIIESKTFRIHRDGVLRCVPHYRKK
jgi:hypothetical protein